MKSKITGLILAGGQSTRMGRVDKGLQPFRGATMVAHVLQRLAPQVDTVAINANRNLPQYQAAAGADTVVMPDRMSGFEGPLAGVQAGLHYCATELLLTVPCDTPLFPADLVDRMAEAMAQENADFAVAAACEEDGQLRPQPVFCLMHVDMLESLAAFTQAGGRKIDAWTAQHTTVVVPFDQPGDASHAFSNANTLAELHQLEARQP